MKKSKALILGVLLALLVFLGALGLIELMSPSGNQGGEEGGEGGGEGGEGGSYLRIGRDLYCVGDAEDVAFSKNPPYFVGEKYYWWIHIIS